MACWINFVTSATSGLTKKKKHATVQYRVDTCLINQEMLGNFTAVRELSGKNSCHRKLFTANFTFNFTFGATPMFSSIVSSVIV